MRKLTVEQESILFYMQDYLFVIFIKFFFSGERPTAESIAEAVIDKRAELVHLPSAVDLSFPMPSKQCADCDGTVC